MDADAKNCAVVRELNAILRENKRTDLEEIKRLRNSTIRLQGGPFSESGLPYLAAVQKLNSIKGEVI